VCHFLCKGSFFCYFILTTLVSDDYAAEAIHVSSTISFQFTLLQKKVIYSQVPESKSEVKWHVNGLFFTKVSNKNATLHQILFGAGSRLTLTLG
jgi:hypothetical protein